MFIMCYLSPCDGCDQLYLAMRCLRLYLVCLVSLCYSEEIWNQSVIQIDKNGISKHKVNKVQPNDHPNKSTDKIKLRIDLNDVFLQNNHIIKTPRNEPITNLRKKKKTLSVLKKINNEVHPTTTYFPKRSNPQLVKPKISRSPKNFLHLNTIKSTPKSESLTLENYGNKTKEADKVVVNNTSSGKPKITKTDLPIDRVKADCKPDHNRKEKHAINPVKQEKNNTLINVQRNKNATSEAHITKKTKKKLTIQEIARTKPLENTTIPEHKIPHEDKKNKTEDDRNVLENVMKQLPTLIKSLLADKNNITVNRNGTDSTQTYPNLNLTFTKSDKSDEVLKLLIRPIVEKNAEITTDLSEFSWTTNTQNGTTNCIQYSQQNGTASTDATDKSKSETNTKPENIEPKVKEIPNNTTEKLIQQVNDDITSLKSAQQLEERYKLPPSQLNIQNSCPSYPINRVTLPVNPFTMQNIDYNMYQNWYKPDFSNTKSPFEYPSQDIMTNIDATDISSEESYNNDWSTTKAIIYSNDADNIEDQAEENLMTSQPPPMFNTRDNYKFYQKQPPMYRNYYQNDPIYKNNFQQIQPWSNRFYQDQNIPGSCVYSRLSYSHPHYPTQIPRPFIDYT